MSTSTPADLPGTTLDLSDSVRGVDIDNADYPDVGHYILTSKDDIFGPERTHVGISDWAWAGTTPGIMVEGGDGDDILYGLNGINEQYYQILDGNAGSDQIYTNFSPAIVDSWLEGVVGFVGNLEDVDYYQGGRHYDTFHIGSNTVTVRVSLANYVRGSRNDKVIMHFGEVPEDAGIEQVVYGGSVDYSYVSLGLHFVQTNGWMEVMPGLRQSLNSIWEVTATPYDDVIDLRDSTTLSQTLDTIRGGDGNDTIHLGGGVLKSVQGGEGDDVFIFHPGALPVGGLDGGAGYDVIDFSDLGTRVWGAGGGLNERLYTLQIEKIIFTPFRDWFTGGETAQELVGGAGDDVIEGRGGNDILVGGLGADYLDGGSGRDTVAYDDAIGDVRIDLLAGQGSYGIAAGDVYVNIENAIGGAGRDSMVGSASANVLNGGGGNDVIIGNGGADRMTGGSGADRFTYNAISDSAPDAADIITDFSHSEGDRIDLSRLDANRLLSGKQVFSWIGDSAYTGIAGQVRYQHIADQTIVYADTDGDSVSDFELVLNGTIDLVLDDILGATNGQVGYVVIRGTAANDVLVGDSRNNEVWGYEGDDQLSGGAGDDVLLGGAGADHLDGGSGNDTISYAGAIEDLRADLVSGTGRFGDAAGDVYVSIENIIGGEGGDSILGSAASNHLDGRDGGDLIIGNGGADILTGGIGADRFIYNAISDSTKTATDVITDFSQSEGDRLDVSRLDANQILAGKQAFFWIGDGAYDGTVGQLRYLQDGNRTMAYADTDGDGLSDLVIALNGHIDLTGDDIIGLGTSGTASNDVLDGTADADQIGGFRGDDTLSGGSGDDALFGGAGDDTLRGGEGADYMDGGYGNDTAAYDDATSDVRIDLLAGRGSYGIAVGDVYLGIENALGGSGRDSIVGSHAANALKGGGGDDVIIGNGGADRMTGDSGADRFVYNAISDSTKLTRDLITDFSRSDGDRIDLSRLDANEVASGKQAFAWIGNSSYTGVAGQLRYLQDGDRTIVYADTDGDGISDFAVALSGSHALSASDFLL